MFAAPRALPADALIKQRIGHLTTLARLVALRDSI